MSENDGGDSGGDGDGDRDSDSCDVSGSIVVDTVHNQRNLVVNGDHYHCRWKNLKNKVTLKERVTHGENNEK